MGKRKKDRATATVGILPTDNSETVSTADSRESYVNFKLTNGAKMSVHHSKVKDVLSGALGGIGEETTTLVQDFDGGIPGETMKVKGAGRRAQKLIPRRIPTKVLA